MAPSVGSRARPANAFRGGSGMEALRHLKRMKVLVSTFCQQSISNGNPVPCRDIHTQAGRHNEPGTQAARWHEAVEMGFSEMYPVWALSWAMTPPDLPALVLPADPVMRARMLAAREQEKVIIISKQLSTLYQQLHPVDLSSAVANCIGVLTTCREAHLVIDPTDRLVK